MEVLARDGGQVQARHFPVGAVFGVSGLVGTPAIGCLVLLPSHGRVGERLGGVRPDGREARPDWAERGECPRDRSTYRAGDTVGHCAPDCRTEHLHSGPYPRLPCEAVGVPFGVRREVTDRGSALTDPAGAPCAGGDDHGIGDEEAILVDGAREQGGFALRRRFLVTILAVPADKDITYPAQFVQASVHLVPPGIASFRFQETGGLFPRHPIAVPVQTSSWPGRGHPHLRHPHALRRGLSAGVGRCCCG